jgi:hypothetical protein
MGVVQWAVRDDYFWCRMIYKKGEQRERGFLTGYRASPTHALARFCVSSTFGVRYNGVSLQGNALGFVLWDRPELRRYRSKPAAQLLPISPGPEASTVHTALAP